MQISLLESQTTELANDISSLHKSIDEKSASLSLSQKEVQLVKELLLDTEEESKMLSEQTQTLSKELTNTKSKISQLNSFVKDAKSKHDLDTNYIEIKDAQIVQLQKVLLLKKRDYQRVLEDLNITKIKIKNLTGIKISVVQKLKEQLGDSIKIDSQSGALAFSSNILFNQNKSELKAGAKKELSRILGRYIDVLLNDPKMRRYIDLITIEGHTNSDGSYLYNLNLSQQRALSVMHFLYERYPKNRKLFRRYLSASGRSYAQPILDANNEEDKDASRRIEIKFRIKSEDTVRELMNYLDKR